MSEKQKPGIFRSAITARDGTTDVAYLSMFVVLALVLGVIPNMVVAAWWQFFSAPANAFPFKDLGTGVRDVTFGLSTALGALAAYQWADGKPPSGPVDK